MKKQFILVVMVLVIIKDSQAKCCGKVCAASPDGKCNANDNAPLKVPADVFTKDVTMIKETSKNVYNCQQRVKALKERLKVIKENVESNKARIEKLKKLRISIFPGCDKFKSGTLQSWNATGLVTKIFPTASNGSQLFNNGLKVYCEVNDSDGNNWMVFQRRMDGSVLFNRTWKEYSEGFGNLNGEFWLGLEKLHKITQASNYELRIDLKSFEGIEKHAVYDSFRVGTNESNYNTTFGNFSSTSSTVSEDQIHSPRTADFLTFDHFDQWPYYYCYPGSISFWDAYHVGLNTPYHQQGMHKDKWGSGINWYDDAWLDDSLMFTEMKIRKIS